MYSAARLIALCTEYHPQIYLTRKAAVCLHIYISFCGCRATEWLIVVMKKNKLWLLPVLTCIVASVASVFLPILTYAYPDGRKTSFNILNFAEPSQELTDILAPYNGPINIYIDRVWATVLAILAVSAIVAAFLGVITMSMQRHNTWQFLLALLGIIGTAIPAIIVIVAVPLSQKYLPGSFQFGVYPIITPIAMAMCLITVTRKHKRTKEERLAAEKAKDLIRPGGDL